MHDKHLKFVPSKLAKTIFAKSRGKDPSFLTTNGKIINYFINEKNASQSGTLKNKDVTSAHIEISSKSLLPNLVWIFLTALLGIFIYFSIDNSLIRLGSIAVTSLAIFYFLYEHIATDTGVSIVITTHTAEVRVNLGAGSKQEEIGELVESIVVQNDEGSKTSPDLSSRVFSPR